ncbi:lysylphosphatidylglycerol synthase transmembrane domain-containing protein [Cellulomonas marina]|uniref:Undecaprenyl-diphosphatase n=1 Tax=Cellulomonas marina TaxID=988821 RepID=A0A1I0YHK3_9CELL|nr:lysylphosphatidylglycerol synthase transmembrane domain-containing protein [Cellulomonas marina]GIG28702.1 membrane protein [Cellulomonas marina]SFB12226.1 conserved hypothetical protein [Cellulomonas marina]
MSVTDQPADPRATDDPARPDGGAAAGTARRRGASAWDGRSTPVPVVGDEPGDGRARRVHHPSDLVDTVVAALGVVLVMVAAVYAQNTATGVAEDVQASAELLRRVLFVPVAVLEGTVTLLAPLAVLTELAVRRLGRQVLEVLAGAVAAVVLSAVLVALVRVLGSAELQAGLSVVRGGARVVEVPGYLAMLVGLLTVAGPRTRRRSVRWSWNGLWVATGVLLVTAQAALPAIAVALLVGRTAGQGVRYALGVRSERAYGVRLVEAVRRAGFAAASLQRAGDDEPLTRTTDHRVYTLTTTDGGRHALVAMDGDRQVVGGLARLWRSLRLRGIEGRSVVSLRQAAERFALLNHAAQAAGVRVPALEGMGQADDTMVLVLQEPARARALSDVPAAEITDAVLRAAWEELARAHAAGVAHRGITADAILLAPGDEGTPQVWFTAWDQGDVACSDLARRLDLAQLVAVLALRVGATRAIAAAADVLPDADLVSIGPLLQPITLPRRTRMELRDHKEVLPDLREELVARIPEADVAPEQLTRFGARTLLSILVTILALFVVLTSINVSTIAEALEQSDWRWSVVAFALGLVTLLGAALTIVAFSPVRLSVWRATIVQTAATFVALAAPAGVGPAALNLRMLTRRGVSTSLAGATVALVQVSQFVVTVLLLLGLSVVTGRGEESTLPISPAMLVAVGVIAALVAAALLVPKVRQWAVARILPVLAQTWPRLIAVLGQPWRLALAVTGNLVMTLGYVFALDACLAAFGRDALLVPVALAYLAGNTAGSLVPTPGGVGTVELALAGSLASLTGVNVGIATSVAVLFRVLTYWLRVPLGWAAMRYLQKRGEL